MPLRAISRGAGPLPHPASHQDTLVGGRVGEWAKPPKVPTIRRIVGMAAEGGAVKCGETAFSKPALSWIDRKPRDAHAGA